MAVYTDVPESDLDAFIAQYDVGSVLSYKGIAEGIENTNYVLHTQTGQFILTLYERRVHKKDLPFFLGLMEHAAAKGVSCPVPVRGRDGEAMRNLCGRPAALVTFLEGIWPHDPTPGHCEQLGRAMANLHTAAEDFDLRRNNDLSVAGWRTLFGPLAAKANRMRKGWRGAIKNELDALEESWPRNLPEGVIHGDLFPDNVFFLDRRLSGLIDFYFACNDFLAYDLAVALNSWCFDAGGSYLRGHAQALFEGYSRVREPRREEIAAMPVLARGAGLRFVLTRLQDWNEQPSLARLASKDPLEYWARVEFHQSIGDAAGYGLA